MIVLSALGLIYGWLLLFCLLLLTERATRLLKIRVRFVSRMSWLNAFTLLGQLRVVRLLKSAKRVLTTAFRQELIRSFLLCVHRQTRSIPPSLDLPRHVFCVHGRLAARSTLFQLLTVECTVIFQLLVQRLNLLKVS